MHQFAKKLETDFGDAEFLFNKIYTVNGTKYYVVVNDKEYNLYSFIMEPKGNKWCIVNTNIQSWIKYLESELSVAIIDNTKKN